MKTKLFFVIFFLTMTVFGAQAGVQLTGNYTGNGEFTSYSEGVSHKTEASAAGYSEYSLIVDMEDGRNSTVFQGLSATKNASFVATTPEYDLRIKDATNFYGTTDMGRESIISVDREVITEVDNGSLVQTTTKIATGAYVATDVSGSSGMFSEDIDIASGDKGRTLKLREIEGNGSFSLETNLTLSGDQVKRDFGVLNETEMLTRGVKIKTDDENGFGVLRGV
jgi:hypothetical protein